MSQPVSNGTLQCRLTKFTDTGELTDTVSFYYPLSKPMEVMCRRFFPNIRAMTFKTIPALPSLLCLSVSLDFNGFTTRTMFFLSPSCTLLDFSTNIAMSKNNLQLFYQHFLTFKPILTSSGARRKNR